MVYLKVAYFLTSWDVPVLGSVFALVWVFGVANWCKNVYRTQNKKFARCQRNILLQPQCVGLHIACLPEEYRRQWRAYVNSNALRPSLVWEFVPRKNKVILWPLFAMCAMVSTLYFAIFLWNVAYREYVVFQVAFWLSFALVMLANKLCFQNKQKHARQVFGKFVAQLNVQCTQQQKHSVAQQLHQLKNNCDDNALAKASQLLHQSGAEVNRTVQEQQQINQALNGLLQAYARKQSQKT